MANFRKPLAIEFPILQVNKIGNWTKNDIQCPELINDSFFVHKFNNGVIALISNFSLPDDMNDKLFINCQAGTIMQQSIYKDRFCVIIEKSLI